MNIYRQYLDRILYGYSPIHSNYNRSIRDGLMPPICIKKEVRFKMAKTLTLKDLRFKNLKNNKTACFFIGNNKWKIFYSNNPHIPKGYHYYNSSDPFNMNWNYFNTIKQLKNYLGEKFSFDIVLQLEEI